MSIRYDTAEIRRYARRLQRCADAVQDSLRRQINRSSDKAAEASSSETERAIQERLGKSRREAENSCRHLTAAARSMFSYADKLDEADRAARAMIGSK